MFFGRKSLILAQFCGQISALNSGFRPEHNCKRISAHGPVLVFSAKPAHTSRLHQPGDVVIDSSSTSKCDEVEKKMYVEMQTATYEILGQPGSAVH